MINVYIIDDHPAIIEGLKNMLEYNGDIIKIVGTSLALDDAIPEMKNVSIDVLILDLFLDDSHPVENVKKIKSLFPRLPIVIYSCESAKDWMIRMFKEGISAYLVKSEDEKSILPCLIQAKNNCLIIPPDIIPFVNSMITGKTYDFSWDEISIVKELAYGVPIKVIASKFMKSASSIEKTIVKLRERTCAKSTAELVRIFIEKKWLSICHSSDNSLKRI